MQTTQRDDRAFGHAPKSASPESHTLKDGFLRVVSQEMVKCEALIWDTPGAAAQPRNIHIRPDGEVGSFGGPPGNRLQSDRLPNPIPPLFKTQ